MTTSDFVIAFATLFGPILAVLATRFVDDIKAKKERKFNIFNTLMATRAYPFTLEHVGALNRIDVEFSNKEDKKIAGAWNAYHDHLSNKSLSGEAWIDKKNSLFIKLLFEMSQSLGYSYDETYLKNMSYSPERHGIIENEQDRLRTALLELFSEGSIPITIKNFPVSQNNSSTSIRTENAV